MDLFLGLFSTKIAYASTESFNTFLTNVDSAIVNPLISLLFALAVVYFLYGVLEFIMNQDNEEKKTTGKSHMMWGIIGIAIMVTVFAILNVVLSTFHITGIKPETGDVNLPPYNPTGTDYFKTP